MLDPNASSSPASSPFDIPADATLQDVIKYLQNLQGQFAAHTHDGINSQQLVSLVLQALTSITIAIRKASFSDTTPGFWVGLVNNVVKLSLGADASNSLTWDGSNLVVNGSINGVPSFTFFASEDIAAGAAVAIGDGASDTVISATTKNADFAVLLNSTHYYAQTFTTPSTPIDSLVSVTLYYETFTGPVDGGLSVYIYATSGGLPTGSPIGTASMPSTSTDGAATGTFSSPIPVASNTVYAIVIIVVTNANGSIFLGYDSAGGYAGGQALDGGTTGASYSVLTGKDFYFSVAATSTTSGQLCNASSASINQRYNNFIGFATTALSKGIAGVVQVSGILSATGPLTFPGKYYLNDTPGTIGASAGSHSLVVGFAIDTTHLITKNNNF